MTWLADYLIVLEIINLLELNYETISFYFKLDGVFVTL